MNDLKPTCKTATSPQSSIAGATTLSKPLIVRFLSMALLVLSLPAMTANGQINSQQLTDKPNLATLTIGIIGDSLSAGYGLKQHEGWADLLGQKLALSYPHVDVINASISGATTDAGLQMQAGLLHQNPDIIILELGANDGLQGKPLGLIKKNLATLITQAQKNGADVLLVGIKLPPNLGKRYTEPFFAQFETLAEQHKTALVPFLLEGIAGNPKLMQADGLHPNSAAQNAILEIVWQPLEDLLQQNQTKGSQ